MIAKETIQRIDSIPISRFFPSAENKGNYYYCKCHSCGAEGKKKSKQTGLQIVIDPVKDKNFAKCFKCGFSLRGAISTYAFQNNLNQKTDFIKILKELAERRKEE